MRTHTHRITDADDHYTLVTKKQSDQIEAIRKRAIRIIYPYAHDMPYTSAIYLADLPTMSDRRDQLARKLFNPQSNLHPIYITFFPLLRIIHLSLDYESLQNFLASQPEPKNTNHSSSVFSPTLRLHNCCFIVFIVFFSVCFFYSSVQPLATTFYKRYDYRRRQ